MLSAAEKSEPGPAGGGETQHPGPQDPGGEDAEADAEGGVLEEEGGGGALEDGDEVMDVAWLWSVSCVLIGWRHLLKCSLLSISSPSLSLPPHFLSHSLSFSFSFFLVLRRYEEDMYWRRVEEEQHHWDDRRRLVDGGYPQGPPGLLGVRPGLPGLQPQGSVVRPANGSSTC